MLSITQTRQIFWQKKKRINPKKYIKTENFAAPKVKLEDKKRKNRTKIKKEKTCYGNTCELFIALFGFFFLLMHNIYTQQTVRDLHKLYFMTVSLIYFIHLLLFYISIPSILRLTVSYLMCVIFLRACFSTKIYTIDSDNCSGTFLLWHNTLKKNLLLHTTKINEWKFSFP